MLHVADAWLEADEVLTFRTGSGTELDLARKSWGYYTTPSLNARLPEHGLRAALVAGIPREGGATDRLYVLLCEAGEEDGFNAYLEEEDMRVVAWLDSDDAVAEAVRRLDEEPG